MNAICTSNMMRENDLAERTPLSKTKPSGSPLVMIPVGADPDSEEFMEAAKKLGIKPDDLVKVIDFQEVLRSESNRLKLSPPHIVSACLNLVGDLLNEYVNDEHKADMVTSIFRQLWTHAGLASDHAEGSVKVAPAFNYKGEKY
jgi:hypothetical protein